MTVAQMFIRHLGRAPSEQDLAYWGAVLAEQGEEATELLMASSAEAVARRGGAPPVLGPYGLGMKWLWVAAAVGVTYWLWKSRTLRRMLR